MKNNYMPLTPAQIHALHWESTDDLDIYQCWETKKFHFMDETQMLDGNPFETLDDARRSLKAYVKTLGGSNEQAC